MRALKVEARINADHTLQVQLPEDTEEGWAEVIVLLPERSSPRAAPTDDVFAFITALPSGTRAKGEIDEAVGLERDTWGGE